MPNPPTLDTSTTASTSTDTNPISPITRQTTFPHKTSAAVSTTTPFIETSMPAINQTPVEIDGTPTSPEELLKRKGTGGSVGSMGGGEAREMGVMSPDLAEEEEALEEMGEIEEGKGVGRGLREKRAALLASRSKDPSVIVDLPAEPTAEEVEAAKAGAGTVTPAVDEEKMLGGR